MRGGAAPGRTWTVPLDPPGRSLLLAEPFPIGSADADPDGAPPVVLVSSGMGGVWHDWVDVARVLRGRARVLVVDRPGCGDAPAWAAGTTDLGTAADDLSAAMDSAGVDRAVFVGHSMGAWYVEACARRSPERVAGLVLVDGSVASRTRRRPSPWLVDLRFRVLDALARHTLGWSVVGPQIRRVAEGSAPRRDLRVAHRAWCRATYSRPGVWEASLRESSAYPVLGDALERLRPGHPLPPVPVRVISAAGALVPPRWSPWVRSQRMQARRLSAGRPGGGVHTRVLRPAPHMVMLTHPEAVAGEITRALADAHVDPATGAGH